MLCKAYDYFIIFFLLDSFMPAFSGSLSFPLLHDSQASASRDFYSINSTVTERQTLNSGFKNMEYQQDVFPMHFTESVSDWSMPNGQDFLSSSNHCTLGTNFERAIRNDTFGFINGSNGIHQLMDKTGIIDGIFDGSVRNSYQFPENVEPLFMDLSGYSDIVHDPNPDFSLPYNSSINEPFYFDSLSSNHNGGMLSNVKTESEEPLMRKLLRNNHMNYETLAERPGGIAVNDRNLDIGPYVSGEGSKTFIESASGFHGLHSCNMPDKTQMVCVKNEKRDAPVPVPRTVCKKMSVADGKSLGDPPKNMRKTAKLKPNDEQSGHQVPSQVSLVVKNYVNVVHDYCLFDATFIYCV